MSSSSSGDLPDWVKTFSPPAAQLASSSKLAIDLADSSDEEDAPAPAPKQPGKVTKAAAAQKAAAQDTVAAASIGDALTGSQVGTQTQQLAHTGRDTQAEPVATQVGPASQAADAAAAVAVKGEVAVMLPDKIPATKILLEMRPTGHSEAAELAGDTGAVGRMVVAKSKEGGVDSFQIDLKGVLYDASVLPLAGTAMVINIGPLAAKVEAVMHDFVRLQEDVTVGVETVEGNLGNLLGDDDEVYQVADDGGEGAGDGERAAAGKKKAASGDKKAGGKKAVGSAKGGALGKLAVKGGVKKTKAAGGKKPAAGAKGKSAKAGGGAAKKTAVAKKEKTKTKEKGSDGAKTKGAGVAKGKSPAKKKSKKDESTSEDESMDDGTGEDSMAGDDDDSDYE